MEEWRLGVVAKRWSKGVAEYRNLGEVAKWRAADILRSGGVAGMWRCVGVDVTEWWLQRSKFDHQRQFRMQLRFRENSSLVIMRFDRRC